MVCETFSDVFPSPQAGRASFAHLQLARGVIDLPADNDHHRHLRDGGRETREPEEPIGADSKRLGKEAHAG
jgi:hypothetical protein